MAVNYEFNYAQIDISTGECIGVRTQTYEVNHPAMIRIPVYDDEYVGKYYIDGNWYEDAAGTIPWQSSLL